MLSGALQIILIIPERQMMNTEKLYYEDSHLMQFEAEVLSCVPQGGAFQIVLDQTAFYPEGGGQPSDQGTLNGVPVTYVREKEPNICQVCVWKDGKEIFSEEWNGYRKTDCTHVMSATKSITIKTAVSIIFTLGSIL